MSKKDVIELKEFLDKNNSIVKVHSGFDGPATSKFAEFKNEFETTIKELNK